MRTRLRPFAYKLFAVVCLLGVSGACSKENDPTGGLSAPVAVAATNISGTGFVATWNSVANASGYQIDISSDNFATFVTDYNNRYVAATTEAVAGLTPGTTYKYRVRSFNNNGTSENSNEITLTTSYGPIATINGELFTPTDLTLTDTNIGLELHMKDGANDITFRLSDKVAGTYALLNTVPNGHTAAAKTVIALWVNGEETFYGESGSVVVTIATDGKVSLTFNATGKSGNGTTYTITNGEIEHATVTPPGITQCTLATYSETHDGLLFMGSFGYDSEGRLIQLVAAGTIWNYFWTGSQVTRAIYFGDDEILEETWTYQDNLLTNITGTSGDDTYEITHTYTAGKLTKVVREDVAFTYSNTISYEGDNVSSIEFSAMFLGDVIDSYTNAYSDYDSKNNFWQLLATSINNPIPTGFSDSVDGTLLSKNNVGKITRPGTNGPRTHTYTYKSYNAANYPTSLDYTYVEEDYYTGLYSVALTYSGCN